MSVWRQRKAIEHAIAGQLNPEDEAKLREHLRGCLECRRYYDALAVQARILAGDPHSTAVASERELARLIGGLKPAPAAPAPDALAWWPRFAVAAGIAAAVVFGLLSWNQSNRERPEQVAMRGGPPAAEDAGEPFELWVVTAPQDGGALRRDLAFPADPVARIQANEWVAFANKAGAQVEHVRVVLVSEGGQVLVLETGESVALDPGQWRAFGVGTLDQGPDDPALIAAALDAGVGGKSLKLPGSQVSGLILVQP